MNSFGRKQNIPTVIETEYVRKQICLLEDTIRQCDVLFLVMDSRESRWLPTLLASIHNKLAITG